VTDILTLHEAAVALGVHYMTAYRYVRLGLLPAIKAGGAWQVKAVDVDAFRAGGALAPQAAGGSRRRAPWAERLEARLLAGDARGSWGVVEAALAAGADPDEIYVDVLGPAMASIGDRWERGEIDVSLEHRATAIAMRLVGRLGPRFVGRGRTRGAIIVGAPAGEHHALPVAMLADLLRGRGWDVSDLGADVPHDSFVHAVQSNPDVVAVGISVTTELNLRAARGALRALRAETPGVTLVVGGRAITDEAFGRSLGADMVAHDAGGFASSIEALPGPTRLRTSG
jgi:MerR family transcriptional regulator, light-induced transcriptional regulator